MQLQFNWSVFLDNVNSYHHEQLQNILQLYCLERRMRDSECPHGRQFERLGRDIKKAIVPEAVWCWRSAQEICGSVAASYLTVYRNLQRISSNWILEQHLQRKGKPIFGRVCTWYPHQWMAHQILYIERTYLLPKRCCHARNQRSDHVFQLGNWRREKAEVSRRMQGNFSWRSVCLQTSLLICHCWKQRAEGEGVTSEWFISKPN